MSRETWTVKLYKGADVDPTYRRLNVTKRNDGEVYGHRYNSSGTAVFLKLIPSFTMNSASVVVPNKSIRFDSTGKSFYDLYSCNYLTASNGVFTYYGFINKIDYENDATARVDWTVDYWNTFRDKIDLTRSQQVIRASLAPKEYMIDARRTADPSLPVSEKNRLIYTKNIGTHEYPESGINQEALEDDSDIPLLHPSLDSHGNDLNQNPWYIFYLLPESQIKDYFELIGGTPEFSPISKKKSKEGIPHTYKQVGKDDVEESASGSYLISDYTKAFKGYSYNENLKPNCLRGFVPEIYASTFFDDVLKLNLIGGEGYRLIGCEVRDRINLDQFTKVNNLEGDQLYKYNNEDGDLESYMYQDDNYVGSDNPNPEYSNLFDKNQFREEIVIADKKINVDPSLRLTKRIGVHMWDSLKPGFKPVYSFYNINSLLTPIKPNQASDSDPVVRADVDRSIPIYTDMSIGYYLSHINRINAEVEKQIESWHASGKNLEAEFDVTLGKISRDYNVSKIELKNALENSSALLDFNKENDKSLVTSNGKISTGIVDNSFSIDKENLTRSQTTSESNLLNSQKTSSDNLKRSNDTAISNLGRSQFASSSNLDTSQRVAEANLQSSQTAQIENLATDNSAAEAVREASTDQSKKNIDSNVTQSKANMDSELQNQRTNLALQKVTGVVSGLNLTDDIAKFLSSALFSVVTGFLDLETAEEVAGNNTATEKSIADATAKLQKAIADANLDVALKNIEREYKASVTETENSQKVELSNLQNSNKAAATNLKASQDAAYQSLKNSNATSVANLTASNTTAKMNLESSNSTAMKNFENAVKKEYYSVNSGIKKENNSIDNSFTKALNELKKNNAISEINLNNNFVKAYAVAFISLDMNLKQLNNNVAAAFNSWLIDQKAKLKDWQKSNYSQLTDGEGIATRAFKMLTPIDKIYSIQSSSMRQTKDYMETNGCLIERKIPLSELLKESMDNLIDYNLDTNHSSRIFPKQFVILDRPYFEGDMPQEGLIKIADAFANGVYITRDKPEDESSLVGKVELNGSPYSFGDKPKDESVDVLDNDGTDSSIQYTEIGNN